MIEIKEKFALKKHNTFGFNISCAHFSTFSTIEELKELLLFHKNKKLSLMVLGGGSNILFTDNYNGLIIHPTLRGIKLINETDDFIELRVGAGEEWDYFVGYCVEKNWFGIENLSLIPGFVGTCPIQNIGAYGVEVKDVITNVGTVEIETLKNVNFTNEECKFGYRDSIFKNELRGKHVITHVHFKLQKKADFKLSYGNLKDELAKFDTVNLQNVRQAVIDIRNSKLPKPEEVGNAGSFFKNPEIDVELFEQIKKQYSTIPSYPQGKDRVKVPAGWLIEQAGWKGYRVGDAGVHSKQALVLVNYGNASGSEIINLAKEIQKSVQSKFGIELEMEVNVV